MPNMELITSVTVGAGGASSVTLPATGIIPQTYTDLKIVYSIRSDNTNPSNTIDLAFNGSTTGFTNRYLQAPGPASGANFARFSGAQNSSSETVSTFSNGEIYIPNYTGSTNKSYSADWVYENNSTSGFGIGMIADLWSNTPAITTITLSGYAGNFLQNSTFYLYGISNVVSTPKATGGMVSQDSTYWYHTFATSGVFTPTTSLSNVDYLVIAGGGGGGFGSGTGGGGAGGLRSTVDVTGGGGTLESKISLTASTAYTITVGAGGASVSSTATTGNVGGNSSIAGSGLTTITATGGGGGGSEGSGVKNGGNGGSGGGSSYNSGAVAGTGITGSQGYGGGVGATSAPNYNGGGGGGAGAVGANASSSNSLGANGGAGVAIPSFANATFTGVKTYYAGGGGGSGQGNLNTQAYGGTGGAGGGGTGAGYYNNTQGIVAIAGTINTGAGGGAGGAFTGGSGAAGGSGLVILRYAK